MVGNRAAFFNIEDRKKNLAGAMDLKNGLEKGLKRLKELCPPVVRVKNGLDPFSELYSQNDLKKPERRDYEYSPEEGLAEEIAGYRSHGLNQWADAVEVAKERVKKLSYEVRAQIAKEMQEGVIVIFMPGRNFIGSMDFDFIAGSWGLWYRDEDGDRFAHTATVFESFDNMTRKNRAASLVDIPERPYLMLVKPTRLPDVKITKQNAESQMKQLESISASRKRQGRLPVSEIKPHEYVVLQNAVTERAKRFSQTNEDLFAKSIMPVDTESRTIFCSMQNGNRVGMAAWEHGSGVISGNLVFLEETFLHYKEADGQRLVVRIPL